jgi:hypothetical protein
MSLRKQEMLSCASKHILVLGGLPDGVVIETLGGGAMGTACCKVCISIHVFVYLNIKDIKVSKGVLIDSTMAFFTF